MQELMKSTRMRFVALLTSSVLAVGLGAAPAASAARDQTGLVNVDVSNVANNNNVSIAIPINAAANICGLTVPVLSAGLVTGPVTCDARANQEFTVSLLQ